jgi:AcrR family transcriptional regulator
MNAAPGQADAVSFEPAMPRLTKARADARREQILKAASACFAKHGFERTTMQQIFAAARLSPGSVYTWFPSKESIVRELLRRRLKANREAAAEAADDPRAAIHHYLEPVKGAATDAGRGWMNIQLVADARANKLARNTMRMVADEGVAVLKKAMRKLHPNSRAEADARARLLQAAAFGIVVQSLISSPSEVASMDLAERLLTSR